MNILGIPEEEKKISANIEFKFTAFNIPYKSFFKVSDKNKKEEKKIIIFKKSKNEKDGIRGKLF